MRDENKRIRILIWILLFTVLFAVVNRKLHIISCSIEDGKLKLWFMKSPINSMEMLVKEVNEALENGEEELNLVIQNISNAEIEEINSYAGGFWGNVEAYGVSSQKDKSVRNLQLELELSDNYYIYRCYVYGEDIPATMERGEELLLKVRVALAECIRPGMTDYEKELAIYEYLLTRCSYGFLEENEDDSYNVYGALLEGTAVCNGYAQAFMLLASCCGLECEMVYGTAGGESHAWNSVKLDGEWYMVDATWDDPVPDATGRKYYAYFNVTSEYMSANHTWEESCFPKCEATKYNYFYYNDLVCENVSDAIRKIQAALNESRNVQLQFRIKDMGDNVSLQALAEQTTARQIAWLVEKPGPDGVIWVDIKGR